MPDPPIKPAAQEFTQLLATHTFRVPRYQRAYDWGKDEVADFAHDIASVVKARLKGNTYRHFFGAIISIFEPQNTFEIVDGQQRLTTHMLCLKELRDNWLALAEVSRQNQKSVRRAALKRAEELDAIMFHENSPRLLLSKRDKDYFADILTDVATKPKRGADQSHRRLWEARVKLREELFEPLIGSTPQYLTKKKRLQALQNALLEDGYVVHLHTTDNSDAYRLFSVLNDRGKPLSAGSLLRTHTLAVLEGYGPQQDAAEKDWDEMLRRGDRFVNRFLAAFYVSHTGTRAPTGEMFDRFRDRFLAKPVNTAGGATRLREKIANLREEAETFSLIYDGAWPYEKPNKSGWEQDRLKRLVKSLGHRLADPLLLAVAREATETAFRDLVAMLEPFTFRYINIVNASAARLEGLYFSHAKKVRSNGALDKNALRNDLRGLLKRYAPEDVFVTLLREVLRFSGRKESGQLLKHFLTTLEDYEDWFASGASGKPKPANKSNVFNLDDVNIEHIYPQNPNAANPLLEPLKHSLGNLTALDEGEGKLAGNQDFSHKKAIYEKSQFKISRPLADVGDWDPAAVAARVEFYCDRARKMFVVN